jgi:methyl-accepting chemotaxis protein
LSLATRLTIWYTLIFSAIVLIAFLTVYAAINTILDVRMDEDLAEDIEELRLLYRQEGLGRLQQELEREVQGGDAEQVFLRLLDTAGNTLYATDMQAWADVKVDPAQLTELSLRDDPILASIAPPSQEFPARTALAALDTGLIIHIGESTEEQREIVAVLARVLAILLCVVIPLVALVGWFIARRAVVGISEVNRISREIHHGDLKRRVAIRHWGKEVEVLAETFNAMIDRIDALVQDMRDLTDNVAHDLRSPLARIRAIAESSLFQDENA